MARQRLAVIASHPIQYFAPWFAELTQRNRLDLKVLFCSDTGFRTYWDADLQSTVRWDIPLLDGYEYEVLPGRRIGGISPIRGWDNPGIAQSLDEYAPTAVLIFGYAHRSMWRAAGWAHHRRVPTLLFSDSNIDSPRPLAMRIAKRTVVERFYSRMDGALYTSDANRRYHERYGIPSTRLFKGAIPVDQGRLRLTGAEAIAARTAVRLRSGIPQESFVAGFLGKLTPRKRAADLVAAAAYSAGEGDPFHVLLIGDGPKRSDIESTIETAGLTTVHLTGFVNQAKIPDHLAAVDVLCAPSDIEPYSMAVAEAVAAGRPVIVSDRIGCVWREGIAQPGVNAIVYPFGESLSLRRAIGTLQEDPELTLRMSAASVAIGAKHDLGPVSAALEAAVEGVVGLGKR